MNDDRGQLSDGLALVVALIVAYGGFSLAFRYLYPFEESIIADGILAVRGVFIDVLGPTRGAGAFLGVVVVLALLLNVVVFTDLLGPDMTIDEHSTESTDENGGGA